ncbi:hypothetical protein [Streptomyces sp. B93]|nr:hypothetical protein [Streptomyces sp. B93]
MSGLVRMLSYGVDAARVRPGRRTEWARRAYGVDVAPDAPVPV